MSKTTIDPNDPRLTKGVDDGPTEQSEVYLVLSDKEKAKGFIRPVRCTYVHTICKTSTTMSLSIAETYARNPKFYGSTYCVHCKKHLPVGEFIWEHGGKVGS